MPPQAGAGTDKQIDFSKYQGMPVASAGGAAPAGFTETHAKGDQDAPAPAADVGEQIDFRKYSEPGTMPPAPELSEDEKFYQNLPWWEKAASSFETNWGFPVSVQRNPMEMLQGLWQSVRHPSLEYQSLLEIGKGLLRSIVPQQENIDRAFQLQQMPDLDHKAQGFAIGLYALIPVAGPAIIHAIDQYNSGDKAGAAGTFAALATQFLSPAAEDVHPLEFVKRSAERIRQAIPSHIEILQRAAETGPRMTEKLTTDELNNLEKENVKALADYKDAETKYTDKIHEINEDADHKIAKIKEDHALKQAERERKIAEAEKDHAAKVKQAQDEWVRKTAEARKAARGAKKVPEGAPKTPAEIQARRESLGRQQDELSGRVKDNVRSTYDNIQKDFNKRWEANREAVGGDRPIAVQPIADAITAAREKLGGVPADLSVFNQVLRDITAPDEVIDTESGVAPKAKESIPYDRMRKQYTALSQAAYRLPPGTAKASLLDVVKVYDDLLTKANEEAGQGAQYAKLKADWHQFMDDWHDMSGMATGPAKMRTPKPGSPLARLYRFEDPGNIKDITKGPYSDRMLATYARYRKFGADPALIAKLRNSIREEAGLPTTPAKPSPLEARTFEKAPGASIEVLPKPKLPAKPEEPPPIPEPEREIAEQEYLRDRKLGKVERPFVPELKKPPTVDNMIETVRKAKVERARDYAAANRHPRNYDWIAASYLAADFAVQGMRAAASHAAIYVATRFGWRTLLSSEVGIEWLSRITPADVDTILRVYDKFPAAKEEAARAVTEAMVEQSRAKMTGVPPPSVFAKLLSKSQMAEVIKARQAARGAAERATTGASVERHTVALEQAKRELGPTANVRDILKRADEIDSELKKKPAEVAGTKPGFGEGNRLVSKPEYDAARKSFISKLFRMHAGVDPTMVADLTKIGLYHLEAGARTFSDWSAKMISEIGDRARPYLRELWTNIHQMKTIQEQGAVPDLAPVFFSRAEQAIEHRLPDKISVQQIEPTLRNAGVPQEQIKWIDLPKFIGDKTSVSKQDLLDYVRNNDVKVNEVVKGGISPSEKDFLDRMDDILKNRRRALSPAEQEEYNRLTAVSMPHTKFEAYQIPGGTNYRELLLTLPKRISPETSRINAIMERLDEISNLPSKSPLRTPDLMKEWDSLNAEKRRLMKTSEDPPDFTDSHWDEPNVLAHIRFNDRVTPDGKKVLFIEEVQSDWHQKGRTQGYAGESAISRSEISDMRQRRNDLIDRSDRLLHEQDRVVADNWPSGQNEFDAGYNGIWRVEVAPSGRGFRVSRGGQGYYGGTREEAISLAASGSPSLRADLLRNVPRESVMRYYELEHEMTMIQQSIDNLNGQIADATHSTKIPDAPFKKTWHELSMKRMLRYAAENGYDEVAWTTGEQQAERYDLSKHVSKVELRSPERNAATGGAQKWELVAYDKDGERVIRQELDSADKVSDYVGKDVAKTLVERAQKDGLGKAEGMDLKVGGEGMKGFYDKILPDFMNKYGKKWGARVKDIGLDLETPGEADYLVKNHRGEVVVRAQSRELADQQVRSLQDKYPRDAFYVERIPGETTPVHSIEVTPAMKKSVLHEGQPISAIRPPALPASIPVPG